MDFFTTNAVNMDGSDDAGYRYKMPRLEVKIEGSSTKMRKTVLVDVNDVSRSIGRPVEYLLTYLGHSLSVATRMEKHIGKAYVTGAYTQAELHAHVLRFTRQAVLCRHCRNPETTCHVEGKKKRQVVFLRCKACPNCTDLDSADRFVKFMMSHIPQAPTKDATAGGVVDERTSNDISGSQGPGKVKRTCPACGHRSTKTSCSKCGASIIGAPNHPEAPGGSRASSDASQVVGHGFNVDGKCVGPKRSCKCGHRTTKTVCSKCGISLIAGVAEAHGDGSMGKPDIDSHRESRGSTHIAMAEWMAEQNDDKQEAVGLVEKFSSWYQSLSHDQTAPLDQFRDVVSALAVRARAAFGPSMQHSQPFVLAGQAKTIFAKWQLLLQTLFAEIGDASQATIAAVAVVQEIVESGSRATVGTDLAMLGIVIALRDSIDGIGDEEIRLGCQRLPSRSRAVEKFIHFLTDSGSDHESEGAWDTRLGGARPFRWRASPGLRSLAEPQLCSGEALLEAAFATASRTAVTA